ncbi:amino acid adenylation domain-containing protein [Streptosporangium sp. NPDC006930]|uniref:amino acid adenylation domain-containing protein n=1 Tax=Streptosporangium sp. NPDC006930 TaxID=3154783 RepID=UPI0034246700
MTPSPGQSLSSTQLSDAKRALLEKRLRRRAPDPVFTIPRRPPGRGAPLSFGQERLWFMDQFAPGTAAYTIPMTLRLTGPLDVAALERAIAAVVARHESLRTRFPPDEDGRPTAVVEERVEVPLERAEADGERSAIRLVSDAAALPFDLARGPLLRTLLVRVGGGNADPPDAAKAGETREGGTAEDTAGAENHVLLVALHHICGDGWSTDILAEELGASYAGTELPEPPLQYGDYALWQRERPVSEAALAYWRSRLAGVVPLELPLDGRRRGEQTFAGASHGFTLRPELMEGLTRLARESGATLYMVLLAAYQVLLGRYARQDDFAIGSPVGGRPRRELESVIGMFVNVLAMRADLSGDPGFLELLERVRRTTTEAYEHQELPFEQLVGELGIERDVSRSPVFQAVFALQSYGRREGTRWPGLSVEPFDFEARATRFDLELFLSEQPDGMGGLFVYNRDLFDAATIEGMAAQLEALLGAVVATPAARISELNVLPAEERDRVLACAAGPGEPYPDGATLGGMFEAQVARTPGTVALEFEDERLTYAQLEGRANRLAHRLRGLGVGPGSLVAVCAERSVELVVALLGVVKAGGAYVPLDPEYPPERLAFMLADAAVPVLLAQRAVLDVLPEDPGGALPVGSVDTLADAEAARMPRDGGMTTVVLDDPLDEPDTPVEPSATSADAAYMIYTSGSTGRPKGVPNTHGGIRNRLGWMQSVYGLTGDDAVVQKTPAGFDVSVWEFFWPLVTGARLVLARPGGHRDAAYLRDLIVDRGVTTAHFVPSMLAAFLEEEGVEACGSLRRVVCSGEELTAHVAERFFARLPGTGLYNLYGPTEAAIDVSLWRCRPGDATVPIGHPVQNTSLYVLDRHLRPVPFGVPGELHIGGTQVAMGYHARPGLTAERFVPDPFGTAGARLYRTGDLVRLRRDGAIEFLGRIDHQVKIRGQRIELGEIETVLRGLAGVREAVVTVREDGAPGDRRLVAYVVPAVVTAGTAGDGPAGTGPNGAAADGTATSGTAPNGTATSGTARGGTAPDGTGLDGAELRRALKVTLPEHMVPSAFVVLDALPLSPNGKLDRGALPAPERRGAEAAGPGAEPRTPVERAIADIWRELLEVESVGADGDFFELGGHSLVAIQAVARMRKALPVVGGRAVGVMDLFKHPTVRELAALVERPAGPAGPRSLLYELTRPGPALMTYVCIPYGGGSPLIFQPLADALPDGCSLHALAFPGHDPGLPDEETRPIDEVADLCVTEILENIEGPLALYGHCGIGGALVVEVARRLEERGRALEAVYIGAIFPFARPRGRIAGPLARLTRYDRLRGDRVYENRMRSMGTDISGLDDEQIRFMVRNQRRDTLIAEEIFTRVLAERVERLRAPVISVVGEQDPTTDYYQERYREWHFLSDTTALVILDEAGHYFLKYRAAELSEILTNTHIAMGYGAAGTLDRPSRGPGAGWWVEEVSVLSPAPEEEATAPEKASAAEEETTAPKEASAPERPAARERAAARKRPAAREKPAARERTDGTTARAGTRMKAPPPSLRRFMVVAGFQLVSMVGTAVTDFAIPVWIYLTTGSLVDFALFVALSIMPGVVIAPLAGAIVDRSSRRSMMILGNCMAGGTQLVLGALFWTGTLEIWHIYPLTACLSIALIFQRLGFTTALPQLVPKEYMGHAAGVVQMVIGTAQFAAPLLAVALLSSIGLGGILVVDVASFFLVLGALLLIRFPDTMAHSPREPLSKEIAQGLRMSIGNRHLRAAMIYFASLNVMLAALLLSITPLVLSFSTLTVAGQISFVGGLGGALGGMVIALWGGPKRRRMRGVMLATLGLSVFAVITGLRPSAWVVGIGAFGLWGCLSIVNGTFLTIIHTKVPQRFHGRVQSLNQMVSWSTLPIGMAVVAPLGERLLNPLLVPGGALAPTVGSVIGVGPGRGVALMYIVLGLGIAVHVLISMRTRVLSTFDDEMPDAPADDLVGAQILRERAGNRVSVAWTAPAFAKAITMPLSPERAQVLLRTPYPDAEVREVVLRTGGEISAVYEVRCADRDLIVKIYPNVLTARLHKEVHVYELLRGSGASCPEMVHWDVSRRDLPHAYAVMTKVPGRPLSEVSGGLSAEEVAGLYREMGRTLRAVHGVRVQRFGPIDGPQESSNEAYVGGQLDLRLAQFVEFGGDPELHAELSAHVRRDRHLLARCDAPVLCHNDFHERNVMVAETEGPGSPLRMTGVIDMENALGGDPLMDLARTDYFAVRGDAERRRYLLEGYGDLPDDWPERLAFYRLCHALEQWHWLATLGETAALPVIAEQLRECLKEKV